MKCPDCVHYMKEKAPELEARDIEPDTGLCWECWHEADLQERYDDELRSLREWEY